MYTVSHGSLAKAILESSLICILHDLMSFQIHNNVDSLAMRNVRRV